MCILRHVVYYLLKKVKTDKSVILTEKVRWVERLSQTPQRVRKQQFAHPWSALSSLHYICLYIRPLYEIVFSLTFCH